MSWGSVSLILTVFFSVSIELILDLLQKILNIKVIFIIIQLISCISLVCTYFTKNFFAAFILLPLNGLALACFNTIPEILLEKIEKKYQETAFDLLKVSLILSEIITFCFMPGILMIIEGIDEIQDSIIISSGFALISSCSAYLI